MLLVTRAYVELELLIPACEDVDVDSSVSVFCIVVALNKDSVVEGLDEDSTVVVVIVSSGSFVTGRILDVDEVDAEVEVVEVEEGGIVESFVVDCPND